MTLTSKLQLFGEDKNRIIDKCQQLEMQLVTAIEKHKICQIEVNFNTLLLIVRNLTRLQTIHF